MSEAQREILIGSVAAYILIAVAVLVASFPFPSYPRAMGFLWPILALVEMGRGLREYLGITPKPGAEPVRIVYRYPARTLLSRLALWTWRLGVTAGLAWVVWRVR